MSIKQTIDILMFKNWSESYMTDNINDYIGYLNIEFGPKEPESGTCFFIDNKTIVTASHVTNKDNITKLILGYNDTEYIINSKKYIINYKNDCAIIYLYDENIAGPSTPLSGINISFHIDKYKALNWQSIGYQFPGSGPQKTHIDGRLCDISDNKFDYICSNIIIEQPTYAGMSGSPVIINNSVVGILQAQDYIDGTSKNLYFSSIKIIESYLNKESVLKSVYNNIPFEKIEYPEIELEHYICRRIKKYEESDDFSISNTNTLFETIHKNPGFYVLLGEAALGKTYELQHLTLACQRDQNAVFPLYKNLQNIYDGQSISEYIPKLNDYIENGVPFCLILDGYDEITDEVFRDNKFPKMLEQLIDYINSNRRTDKISIVISSRKNFFEYNKFDNFKALEICPLSKSDIQNELSKRDIEYYEFMNQIEKNNLDSFIENPFYLKHLIEIYSEDNSLPEKNELMDSIVTHLIVDKDKTKFKHTRGIKKLKSTIIPLLERISAAYLISGNFSFSEDDFLSLIDENIDEANEELINCTNILDKDSNNNYYFKHNNFREYLSARFLNKKFKDNLDGLLELITFKNKISKNYLNMISFLILIRERSDLTEWITKNCPEHFSLFESDKFGIDVKFNILKNAIDSANYKSYYATYDYQNDICKLVCSDKCVNYLLDIINSSTGEIPLFNALRVLRDSKSSFGCEDRIKQTILDFIDSDKGNEHHRRDAIMVLTDLSINSNDVTDFLHEKYSNTNNKEIRRGLYRYILNNDLSDRFAEFLVDGLSLKIKNELTNYPLIDALKKIKETHSFSLLFEYLSSLTHSGYSTDFSAKEIIGGEFINNLAVAYMYDSNSELFDLVINTSCVFVEKLHKRSNILSEFFSITNTEHIAIDAYFNKYSDNPVVFRNLSKNFSIYFEFLKDGYKSNKFSENQNDLFNFCVRSFDEASTERQCLLNLVRDYKYPDCENSIHYITYSDNYSYKESRKLKLLVEYIFNYDRLKADAIRLIETFGETNITFRKLWKLFHEKYSYIDSKNAILDTLNIYMKFKDSVEDLFKLVESNSNNYDFWILQGASNFIENHDDYQNYFDKEQLLVVEELCKKHIYNYNPLDDIQYSNNGFSVKHYNIRFVLHLIAKLEISLDEDVLCKLMFVPSHLFNDSSNDGFSVYLLKYLSKDKIIEQISYYIDNNLADNIFGDECIRYCTNQNIYLDNVVQLANSNLLHNRCFTFYSWDYLIKMQRVDLIVDLVKERKINEKDFIDHIHLLTDYRDKEIIVSYASEIFESLYSYYLKDEVTLNMYNKLKAQHPYVLADKSYESIDNDAMKSHLSGYLKPLCTYLVKNGSETHTTIYLESTINSKTYSFLEHDTFDTLLANITSAKFVDHLITLIKMIYYNEFNTKNYSTIYSDIEKSLINIGHQSIDEVIDKVSPYTLDSNEDMRRFANKIVDNLNQYENEITHQKFTIDKLKEIVF